MNVPTTRLQAIASSLSIGGLQRHIFICAEQRNPRCCSQQEGSEAWAQLKALLKTRGLSSAPPSWRGDGQVQPGLSQPGYGTVLRSKVDCLRVCERGPIAVVYPDGVWYHSVSGEVLELIVRQHLQGGKPVEQYVFAVDDLSSSKPAKNEPVRQGGALSDHEPRPG